MVTGRRVGPLESHGGVEVVIFGVEITSVESCLPPARSAMESSTRKRWLRATVHGSGIRDPVVGPASGGIAFAKVYFFGDASRHEHLHALSRSWVG